MNISPIQIIRKRIYEVTNVTKQSELAGVLELTCQSSISSGFSPSKRIPREWFTTLFIKFKVNPLWIITGEGEKYIKEFPSYNFYDEYKKILKELKSDDIINKPLTDGFIPRKLFVVNEPCTSELDCNINTIEDNLENDSKLLDKNSNNTLMSSTGFNYIKSLASIYSFDKAKPYTPIIVSFSNYLVEDDFTKFYKFDSLSDESNSYSGILRVDVNSPLDFISNDVYVFTLHGVKVILVRVKLEDNKVKFIYANKEYQIYSCTIEEAKKDYLGKVVDIILNPINLF